MPREWATFSALAIWSMMSTAAIGSSGPAAIRCASSFPSSSSITRYGTPLSVTLKSNTWTMCGWRSDDVISASCWKRENASLSRTRLR